MYIEYYMNVKTGEIYRSFMPRTSREFESKGYIHLSEREFDLICKALSQPANQHSARTSYVQED